VKISGLFSKTSKQVSAGEVSVNARFLIRAGYIDKVAAHGVPHAGCGFGMNRVVQSLMGASMIEDIDAFPVTYANLQE